MYLTGMWIYVSVDAIQAFFAWYMVGITSEFKVRVTIFNIIIYVLELWFYFTVLCYGFVLGFFFYCTRIYETWLS